LFFLAFNHIYSRIFFLEILATFQYINQLIS
jgi:hypothetical protein